jgi:hypothetical protein
MSNKPSIFRRLLCRIGLCAGWPDHEKDANGVASHDLFGWVAMSERKPTAEDIASPWGLWLWMPEYADSGAQLGGLEDIHKATHWGNVDPRAEPFRPESPSLPNSKIDRGVR